MQSITTGTEKQNAFAAAIRQQVIDTLNEDLAPHGYTADDMIANNAEVAAIINISDHRFWLDVVKPASRDIRSIAADPAAAPYL